MIRLDPRDGEGRVYLYHKVDLLKLLQESEDAAKIFGFNHDLRCFCNYLIAHYKCSGFGSKTYIDYPLEML
jgi:hypothetical protein